MISAPVCSRSPTLTLPTPLARCPSVSKASCSARRVTAWAEGKAEGRPTPGGGFSDTALSKSVGRPNASVEARALSSNTPEPAPLGLPMGGVGGATSPAALDRWLNLGFLGAGLAVALATAMHAGPNPWESYQTAVAVNPIETKACISGVVYSLGDLIAQTYEGRDIAEWDRGRVVRSGLCGLLAHGPLSHLYYVALDQGFAQQALIPTDSWLVPLAKVGIDQTAWSLLWNSTYYVLLGLLKAESPTVIAATVRATWWDLLKAGWRLWPLVHLFTYGVIPVQHRLLFVDGVELVWVSILSMYGQQQRERTEAAAVGSGVPGIVACALPGGDGEGGDAAEEIMRGMAVESSIVFESAGGERVVMSPAEVYGTGAEGAAEAAT